MDDSLSAHEKAAQSQPHDSHGYFAPKPDIPADAPSQQPQPAPQSALHNFLHNTTSVSKTHDDSTLLDVHVGNPLRRITVLLEEIKRQKAFSFTLKGSLGIVGVALALSTFGVFGGTKLLCDKGMQTESGVVKVLAIADNETSDIPLIGGAVDYYKKLFSITTATPHQRTVLMTQNGTIHLPNTPGVSFLPFANQAVILTGQYDSCSKVLKVTDPNALEILR